jgi:hypothetical protein
MTREDSIRTRTWVTEDGRYLTVDQISDDHLENIRAMLRGQLTPGYDEVRGRQIASDFVAEHENLLDYTIELDLDAYSSAWLQIIDDEQRRRTA